MLNEELAQRAILEALEGKLKALKASGNLQEGATLELVFWDDLALKYPREIFLAASKEEVSLALAKVAEKSNGRFKLQSLTPSLKERSGVLYAATGLPNKEAEKEAPLFFWKIQYSEEYIPSTTNKSQHIFWLTSGALLYKPNDKIAFSFPKKNSVAYKLLKFFAAHPGKTESKEIAKEIGTSERNISEEVAKLRKAIYNNIGISKEDFIVSVPGYGLGENIKIEEK